MHLIKMRFWFPNSMLILSCCASDRDLAFFAPVKVSVADIEKSINKAAKGLLESVELFDEYRGENLPI